MLYAKRIRGFRVDAPRVPFRVVAESFYFLDLHPIFPSARQAHYFIAAGRKLQYGPHGRDLRPCKARDFLRSRSGFFHPDHSLRRATQNTLSTNPSRCRGGLAWRASSC